MASGSSRVLANRRTSLGMSRATAVEVGKTSKSPTLNKESSERGRGIIAQFWSPHATLAQFRRNQMIQHLTGV